MRGLGVAFNGQHARSTARGIGVIELKLHEGGSDHAANAGIGFELFEVPRNKRAEPSAAGKVERVQVLTGFLAIYEQAGLFIDPHLLVLPTAQHVLGLVHPARGKRVNGRANRFARGFRDDLPVGLQQLLDRRVGVLGTQRQNRDRKPDQRQEKSHG